MTDTFQPGPSDTFADAPQAELPEWRLELSRRLQEIKAKREAGDSHAAGDDTSIVLEPAEVPLDNAGEAGTSPPRPAIARKPRRVPRAPGRQSTEAEPVTADPVQAHQQEEVPDEKKPSAVDVVLSAQTAGDIVVRPSVEEVETNRDQYTKELIDSVVAKLAVREARTAHAPELIAETTPTLAPETGQGSAGTAPDPGKEPESAMPTPPTPVHTAGAKYIPEPASEPVSALEGQAERTSSAPPEAGARSRPEGMSAFASGRAADMPSAPSDKSRHTETRERLSGTTPHPVPEAVPPPIPEVASPPAAPLVAPGETQDARLILLSRTLAGLVDLIIIFLTAGVMIVAVDILEGIDVFDTVSKINYGLLFLVMYFFYSFFFLGVSGQTIGMMLTDLRLTGVSSMRPAPGQILTRCCIFLTGTALAGLGLLWGCFDHQARCLHDLLSRTRVVRSFLD